jgi:hypothetical protein
MTSNQPSRSLTRSNRRLAAALILLGLLMQAVAPYLPMPAMGSRTAWDLTAAALSGDNDAWLPGCLSPRPIGTEGPIKRAPHPGDCAACLVMQQAGSTQPPELPAVPLPAIASRAASSLWQQAAHVAPRGDGFSSRAPPIPA